MLCLIQLLGLFLANEIESQRLEIIPQVPPEVICEWILLESSGNPHAVSHVGAKGLLQLMEEYEGYFVHMFWDKDEPFDIFNPVHNTRIAFYYIYDLYKRTGMWHRAFMIYNAGWYSNAGKEYADKLIDKWFEATRFAVIRDRLHRRHTSKINNFYYKAVDKYLYW